MACDCGNTYNIGMGCCQPTLVNANLYYTKDEVDEKLEELIISGGGVTEDEVQSMINSSLVDYALKEEIPSLDGYATEQWVESQGYLTEHQSLDNYYTKEEIDSMLEDHATKTWVLNQNFVTNSELLQYINNLQEQINSLLVAISGCCGGGGGETIYRWITMTGADDYVCSGTTKMTKEKRQESTDGVTWTDVSPLETRMGSTVLEVNCVDCGYIPIDKKILMKDTSNDTYFKECDGDTYMSYHGFKNITHTNGVTSETLTWLSDAQKKNITDVTIGCLEAIDGQICSGFTSLTSVTISNTLEEIRSQGIGLFHGCTALETITLPDNVTFVTSGTFRDCTNLRNVYFGTCNSIYDHTFDGCQNLESLTLASPVTVNLVDKNAFANTNDTFIIYVPSNLLDSYKVNLKWDALISDKDRFQPIS